MGNNRIKIDDKYEIGLANSFVRMITQGRSLNHDRGDNLEWASGIVNLLSVLNAEGHQGSWVKQMLDETLLFMQIHNYSSDGANGEYLDSREWRYHKFYDVEFYAEEVNDGTK